MQVAHTKQPAPLPLPPKRSNLRTRCIRAGNATVDCCLPLPPNKRDLHVRLPTRRYRPSVTFDETRDVRIHYVSHRFTRGTAFYRKTENQARQIKRALSGGIWTVHKGIYTHVPSGTALLLSGFIAVISSNRPWPPQDPRKSAPKPPSPPGSPPA